MDLEKHTINISGWTKEQISKKVKEIFETNDAIAYIKIDPQTLEYQVLKGEPIPTNLRNPSLREDK